MRSDRHSSLNFTRKSRADERQAGRKGNENPKPMRFSAGFSLLARPLYLIPHRKSTRGKKNLCLPCSMKKRGFPIFFLGFIRVFSDFRQNSVMLKILCILMQKNFCSLFTFPVFGIPLIGSPAHQQSTGLLMLPSCFLRTQQNFAFCGKRLKALP